MKAVYRAVLCLVALTSFTNGAVAGIKWVEVGVNGLTCSLCSGSVERSIKRLNFVEKVSMSLEETQGKVYFKKDAVIDLKKIAKAVKDAGFSVRFLRVEFSFDDVNVNPNGVFTWQGQEYQWLQFKNGNTKGDVALKLIDEGFLPRKEGSDLRKKLESPTTLADTKVYHVVLDQ